MAKIKKVKKSKKVPTPTKEQEMIAFAKEVLENKERVLREADPQYWIGIEEKFKNK